MENITGV